MSSADENQGRCPSGKHNGETREIFLLDQPTGRPSILRQIENLPSTTAPKGTKVCFQTPRRDPLTRRILATSNSVTVATVDDCTKTMQSFILDESALSHEPTQQPKQELSSYPDDNMPIQSKGGYQLDFDNLDAMDPFQGSNKMPLSPAQPVEQHPPTESQHTTPGGVSEESAKTDYVLDETLPFVPSAETSLANVTLDISSTDSSVVTVVKVLAAEGQHSSTATPDQQPSANESSHADQEKSSGSFLEDAPLPTKGSYNFDFDNLEAINPFQTGSSKIQNSPVVVREVSTDQPPSEEPQAADLQACGPDPAQEPPAQVEEELIAAVASVSNNTAAPPAEEPQPTHAAVKLEFNFSDEDEVKRKPPPKKFGKRPPGVKAEEAEPPSEAPHKEEAGDPAAPSVCAEDNEPADCDDTQAASAEHHDEAERVPQSLLPEQAAALDEEFVPGTTFMASDFDGQIDYLEQFGSGCFKESALRKQSLYLKFDPLLMESPKKCAGGAAQFAMSPPATLSRLGSPQTAADEAPRDALKLLVGAGAPSPAQESLVPFLQHAHAEDAIFDMLKYSQKDMDAAIAQVQAKSLQSEEQWSEKYQKLHGKSQEMRKVLAEFDLVIAKMTADQEKERKAAQAKLSDALLENQQVSSDLNSMERSFSDLFRRLEKYKGVVEGYKKNEETLKACAQDYLARIKKEEQRYQTLKAHAEEKISQANEEIAEVRSKKRAEVSALQAQLRREQLKMESLEKRYDQKAKECEEVSKLCDELITNAHTG